MTEGEMEKSKRDGPGCLWGHLPNLCFQHFLPTLIFKLCSSLITSIHMWEYVCMFVNVRASYCACVWVLNGSCHCNCAYCNTDSLKMCSLPLFYTNPSMFQQDALKNCQYVNIDMDRDECLYSCSLGLFQSMYFLPFHFEAVIKITSEGRLMFVREEGNTFF